MFWTICFIALKNWIMFTLIDVDFTLVLTFFPIDFRFGNEWESKEVNTWNSLKFSGYFEERLYKVLNLAEKLSTTFFT